MKISNNFCAQMSKLQASIYGRVSSYTLKQFTKKFAGLLLKHKQSVSLS